CLRGRLSNARPGCRRAERTPGKIRNSQCNRTTSGSAPDKSCCGDYTTPPCSTERPGYWQDQVGGLKCIYAKSLWLLFQSFLSCRLVPSLSWAWFTFLSNVKLVLIRQTG